MERLSTGFRINRAADDAAGLSISEKLTARVQGYAKAKQNASDGISMVQTAEGALGIIQDNLQRIRELVVQGINGTYSANEANSLQYEINDRIQLIADVGAEAEFNGITLLDGTTNRVLQTGADQGQTTTVAFETGQTASSGVGIDVTLAADGTVANDAGHLIEGILPGADFALNRLHLPGATGVDSLAGAAFNRDVLISPPTIMPANRVSIGDLDTIIDNVSRMRSELGATQNAIESKIEYIDIAIENTSASLSRIKDVDVALESSKLIKNQILQQSAAAMLAQANQTPQIALQLLQG